MQRLLRACAPDEHIFIQSVNCSKRRFPPSAASWPAGGSAPRRAPRAACGGIAVELPRERKYTYTRTHTHSCTPPSITSVLYCSVLSPSCEQRRGISVSSSVPPRCPLGLKCPFIARRYLIGSSISPYRCVARTSASLFSRRLSAAALLVLGL